MSTAAATDATLLEEMRAVSRSLVRELGFMGGRFAGTSLSPSAVHALIEIEKGGLTAGVLAERLHLEKSSVSRMLRKLVVAGDVTEQAGKHDGRVKVLRLTAAGKRRVAGIHKFARRQVSDALGRLTGSQRRSALDGMRLYADALKVRAGVGASALNVGISSGYRPGLIARITEMHALFYARESGFGQRFESVVASGLAGFCGRLDHPRNQIWTATHGNDIVGSVAIDGQDMGSDIAHLRWFIVDDSVRGGGVGRRLLSAALAFADEQSFIATHLWTFSGLTAARHLYDASGFVCEEERPGTQWGNQVLEQRLVRPHP